MSYETAKKIKDILIGIKKNEYVLPSIQREFIWSTNQIEKLFDSLMQEYPIGTFLFWRVDKDKVEKFKFYEFLRNYHEKDSRHNKPFEFQGTEGTTAILDGQQRMTSLYLGLMGSYASKKPFGRENNPNAYPTKELYLELLNSLDDVEMKYNFKFLTEEEAKKTEMEVEIKEVKKMEKCFWFKCSEILNFSGQGEVNDYLIEHDLTNPEKCSKESAKFANKSIFNFYETINQRPLISYYLLERSENLDKVLQIFVRINSGGTVLSYSDLLLSIASAQWTRRDARKVIHDFVDSVNDISDIKFNKDTILKSCLVLCDFPDINFKVDNFNKKNMETIDEKWNEISYAFYVAVQLVHYLGYNNKSLRAKNAVIPIAYFLYKNNYADTILSTHDRENDVISIKQWLARALLKGIFGGTADSLYSPIRNIINSNMGRFPLEEIIKDSKGKRKSLDFNEDEIDNFLNLNYGKPEAHSILSLLYPDANSKYHQDHIHPKDSFSKKKLSAEKNIPAEDFEKFIHGKDEISNLQLISASRNLGKNSTPFKKWLEKEYPDKPTRDSFLRENYINVEQSLEFEKFLDFCEQRRANIKNSLISILGVKTNSNQ